MIGCRVEEFLYRRSVCVQACRRPSESLRCSACVSPQTFAHSRTLSPADPSTMPSMLQLVSKQLRSHPALIPLFIFIGGGVTMSATYLCRLALKNPDVSWDRKNNPEPWNKLDYNQQYKLFSINMDYSKLEKDRPDF